MKQALIVDPHGAVEDFVQSALGLYERTTVSSLQEAVALVSCADYHLVLIAMQARQCQDAIWMMVERIAELTTEQALVLVHTSQSDAVFHARAATLGVTVVSAPLGVGIPALIDEATAS